MAYLLREMGIGEILDQAVAVMKNRFGLLVGISSVLYLPVTLLMSFASIMLLPTLPDDPTLQDLMAYQESAQGTLAYTVPISLLLAVVVVPITWGAVIHAVSKEYLHEPTSVSESLKVGARRALPLIGSMILVYLCVMGGLILLVIPGIIFAFWLSLVPQVVVIERLGGTTALGRSRALAKGNIAKIFVLGLLVALIQGAAGFAAGLIPQPHVATVVTAVLQTVFFAFGTAASVILYFSCRCKHEDFDLVRLAQAVHREDEPLAATGV